MGRSSTPFERRIPELSADYAARNGIKPDAAYVCVWGPGNARPMLLRIIVTLEEPNGRGIGQTHEYLLQVNR